MKQGEINRKFFVLNDGNAQMLRADVAVGERVTGASVDMHSCLSFSLSHTHTAVCLFLCLSLYLSLLCCRHGMIECIDNIATTHVTLFHSYHLVARDCKRGVIHSMRQLQNLSSLLSIFVSLPVTLTLSLHFFFLPCFRDRFHIW